MNRQELKAKLKLAAGGDVDAFAELFEEYRPMVYAIAIRYVGENDANDVVMETYLKAWKAITNFHFRSSLKTWLYRIAANCSYDWIRKRQRSERHIQDMQHDDELPFEHITDHTAANPDDLAQQAEEASLVQQALNSLPDEYRITLELRYTDELSYSDIAAATNVKIGTVMSRLFNGKRKLKALLKELT